MNGFIYKCTCLVNGKVYIGQTIQDYNERWRCHIKDSFDEKSPGYNYHFHKAIRKYGKENFKWEIIETISCKDITTLQSDLNTLEIKYIKQFNSFNSGYNSTKGGDSTTKDYREIDVYDEVGNKIKEFESVCDASEYYKISKERIWTNCSRFSNYVPINGKKIIFRYKGDIYSEEEVSKVKSINYYKGVKLFDIDGNFIEEFESPKQAADKFDLQNERITVCCTRKTSFVQIGQERFIFRYSDDICTEEDIVKAKSVKSNPKVAVRAIDSVTGEILGEYETQAEVRRIYNIASGKISEVCSGKRKSAGKYNGHSIKWELINN